MGGLESGRILEYTVITRSMQHASPVVVLAEAASVPGPLITAGSVGEHAALTSGKGAIPAGPAGLPCAVQQQARTRGAKVAATAVQTKGRSCKASGRSFD